VGASVRLLKAGGFLALTGMLGFVLTWIMRIPVDDTTRNVFVGMVVIGVGLIVKGFGQATRL
jgi:hypothetical protein